jgi:hypothetical protein
LAANPTDTNLPTSAVVNLALAMGFNVDDDPAPVLSRGAVVGIGVGSGVVAVTVVVAIAYFVLRWRRNRKGKMVGNEDLGAGQGMTYKSGYHAPQDGLASPTEVKPGIVVAGAEWDGRYGYPVPQGGGYRS